MSMLIMKNIMYLCTKEMTKAPITMNDTFKYNSVDVAKYIIAYANDNNFIINMTKLQKLLYIAYGVYMAIKNERLTNEHPQAWPYGPVFPTTRNKLLKKNFYDYHLSDNNLEKLKGDEEFVSLITLVFNSFGDKTATYLSEWSHQVGSPWDKIRLSDKFKWGDRIPDEYIIDYFNKSVIKKNG